MNAMVVLPKIVGKSYLAACGIPTCVLCNRRPAAQPLQIRASFAADLRRNVWYCSWCHRGGDQLTLWSQPVEQLLYAATKQLRGATVTLMLLLISQQSLPDGRAPGKARKTLVERRT